MATTTLVEEAAVAAQLQSGADILTATNPDCEICQPLSTHVNYWKDLAPSEAPPTDSETSKLSIEERKIAYRKDIARTSDQRSITVHDIHTHGTSNFSIEKQGFQLCTLSTPHISRSDFDNDEAVSRLYHPSVEALLQDLTGAEKVMVYDHHVRHMTLQSALDAPPLENSVDIPGPSSSVHIDDTPRNARRMVMEFVPPVEEAAALLEENRFLIVNVWKPLKRVRRDPFGVIDARTISKEDRHAKSLPAPESLGGDYELWRIRAGEGTHKWWFARGQDVDEALVFKIFDSRDEEGFMGVGHSAFADPEADGLQEPRESVECRALCFV